jgi:hypothetical protein
VASRPAILEDRHHDAERGSDRQQVRHGCGERGGDRTEQQEQLVRGGPTEFSPRSARTAAVPVDHRTLPRRRGETLYAAIFNATLAELAEVGCARLVMERVAARAHTSKASLYKRWPNRAELVLAALRHCRGEQSPAPDTGSLRGDILALLRAGAAMLNGLLPLVGRPE